MALGGGIWVTTNKKLPGAYINVKTVKAGSSTLLGDRGAVAVALPLNWGAAASVIEISAEDFYNNSLSILGYEYNASNSTMKVLREIFKHAKKVYLYNLNAEGTKAADSGVTYGTAKHGGTRGNDISIVISTNAVDSTKLDVVTKVGTKIVETQTVSGAANMVDNDWVEFETDWTTPATLPTTVSLTGGANGTTAADHGAALSALSQYDFHVLCCYSNTLQSTYTAHTKSQRDEQGKKFQCVLYNYTTAAHEGVISVSNTVSDSGADAHALVAWVAGACADCELGRSLTNLTYDGEYTVTCSETQAQLETALADGKFIFHKVRNKINVLDDINTYTGDTDDKSSEFKYNQTVRIVDQIANDVAYLFHTKYIGKIPNNAAGRVSLWNDIVKHHRELEGAGSIENFNPEDVAVSAVAGDRRAVKIEDAIQVVGSMTKLYMTIVVS